MNEIEELVKQKYNQFADGYHALRQDPFKTSFNAFIETPALFEAAGDLKGKRILDAGCGSGITSRKIRNLGGLVRGFDLSEEFIKIARRENPDIEYKVASAENLEGFYESESFDLVLSSLMIHYTDIQKSFSQIARVLKKNGKFVFSTAHPLSSAYQEKIDDIFEEKPIKLPSYFKKDRISRWKMLKDQNEILFEDMPYYIYNFQDISGALFQNGLLMEQILEPQAIDNQLCNPLVLESSKKFPWFVVIRATKQ